MSTATAPSPRPVESRMGHGTVVQPVWVRVTHWLNALGAILMVMSGWRIYNASPLFNFRFPDSITLGGWLAGALQWHFAAMWLLGVNGLVYLLLNIVTGRMRSRFWPLSLRQLTSDFGAALRGHLGHDNPDRYNAVQKAAYFVVHFLWMCGLVFFFLVHVTMVAIVPRTLRTMIFGR